MKKTLLLSLALFAAACSGTEPGPLRVTMSLDKTAVSMEESIQITMTVVNTSTEPVTVFPASAYGPCRFPGFEMFDRDWRSGWEAHFCLARSLIVFVPDPVPLNPGETLEITRSWRPADVYFDGEQLTPGRYRVRGAALTPDRTFHTPVREVIVGR